MGSVTKPSYNNNSKRRAIDSVTQMTNLKCIFRVFLTVHGRNKYLSKT